VKPYYKKENGHFVLLDGDFKHWELDQCLCQYFGSDTGNPVRKNLDFFIPLRNKIEHRSMPELDSTIFGECQALLLNFDEMMEKEFGAKYCLRESLSFSLQLFPDPQNLIEAVKRNPATKPVIEFIQQFRSTISAEVTASGKYSFKAFLIQVTNHKSEHALSIQFMHYDKLSDEDKRRLDGVGAMVKLKNVPVANLDLIRAGEVVRRVQIGLGNPKIDRAGKIVNRFSMGTHIRCWQHYKIRPSSVAADPHATDYHYCVYDKLHNDYGYTQAWIDLLVEKLKDESSWTALKADEN
jgi:hypothetical protein